ERDAAGTRVQVHLELERSRAGDPPPRRKPAQPRQRGADAHRRPLAQAQDQSRAGVRKAAELILAAAPQIRLELELDRDPGDLERDDLAVLYPRPWSSAHAAEGYRPAAPQASVAAARHADRGPP